MHGSRQVVFPFCGSGTEDEMETRYAEIIGERLKTLRERNNLTQKELAKKMLMGSHSMISEFESGKRQLSASALMYYAEIFNVSTDWILYGEESPKRNAFRSESDELLELFFSIKRPSVRKVALEQIRALVKI